jgi:hypothetical protein
VAVTQEDVSYTTHNVGPEDISGSMMSTHDLGTTDGLIGPPPHNRLLKPLQLLDSDSNNMALQVCGPPSYLHLPQETASTVGKTQTWKRRARTNHTLAAAGPYHAGKRKSDEIMVEHFVDEAGGAVGLLEKGKKMRNSKGRIAVTDEARAGFQPRQLL